MARYIDADVLRELIDGGYDLDFSELPETKRELLRMIDCQETADVHENTHGYWEHIGNPEEWDTYVCSLCNMGQEDWGNYCPNCGAKMDEVVEWDGL